VISGFQHGVNKICALLGSHYILLLLCTQNMTPDRKLQSVYIFVSKESG